MAFWILLLINVAFQIVSGLLTNKNAKPEKKADLPHVDPSTPIPVVFGRGLIRDPMLLDYMDFQYEKITVRNPATFFITTTTIGYRYYLGMVFGICWGITPQQNEGTRLIKILIDNQKAWTNAIDADDFAGREGGVGFQNYPIDTIIINRPSFFGAEKQEGGVRVKGAFYIGQDYTELGPQDPNEYWESQRDLAMPNYKDICYFVWQGPSIGNLSFIYGGKKSGYIGNAPRLWPLAFLVERQPIWLTNGVVARVADHSYEEGFTFYDEIYANPIECLYEVLVDTLYGAGINEAHINGNVSGGSFLEAAYDIWSEGLAFAYTWTTAGPVEEMVAEILRYIEAAIWVDPATGLINIILIREISEFNLGFLPTLTSTDFKKLESFTRGSWAETKNEVRVNFTDHNTEDYKQNTAVWRSPANYQIQGANEPAEITFNGCPSMHLASKLAAREGRVVSTPLVRFKGTIDRQVWDWYPGKAFFFDYPEQDISQMLIRVLTMELGNNLDGTIVINCVQDVFHLSSVVATPDSDTVWTDPLDHDPEDAPYGAIGEMPYFLQRDDIPRVFGVASRPDEFHVGYDGALNDEIETIGNDFTPTGILTAELSQLADGGYNTTGFIVQDVTDADLITEGTAAEIAAQAMSLAIIGDPENEHEWIAFESFTDNEDGTVTPDNIWRGLLDTPPLPWPAGSRVWFWQAAQSVFGIPLPTSGTAKFEAMTRTFRGQLSASEATNYTKSIEERALAPLPPYYVTLGGSYTNEFQDTGDIELAWREHSRLAMTQIIKQATATTSPEGVVEYEVKVYDTLDDLIHFETGLSSPEYTYTNADELTDTGEMELQARLKFEIYARRDSDNERSLYPFVRYVYRVDPESFDNAVTVNGLIVTEEGDIVTVS